VATVAPVNAPPVATTGTAPSTRGEVEGSTEPSPTATVARSAPAPQPTTPRPRRILTGPADCNPPFVTDEKGHVHFKAQCF
jgi:hypothetical protein